MINTIILTVVSCEGTLRELSPSIYGLQLFARLKANRFARGNGNLRSSNVDCGRLPVLRGRTLNTPKSPQFNTIAFGQGPLHAFKNGFYGHFGLGFGDPGFMTTR